MTFSAPFSRVMRPAFGPGLAAAGAAAWWLSGGIAAGSAVAVYQPKGAASLAASYSNLANPGTYDAAPGVAPTWASGTGWTFNGTTQYLTTGIVPASTYSMIVRFSGLVTTGGASGHVACGSAGTGANATRFFIRPRYASPFLSYSLRYGADLTDIVGDVSSGIMALAASAQYKDGSYIGAPGAGTWSGTAYDIYIACLNVNGSLLASSYLGGIIQALAVYNTTLSAAQVAAISAAMAAL